MMLNRRFCLLLLGLAVALPALAAEPTIRLDQGWARATPGDSTTGAAYLTIESAADDRLVSASSPVAAEVQVHEHLVEDGVMSMRQVNGIDMHAGQKLVFEPNGLHLMLIGLTQKLTAGQSFPITLTFQKAGSIETQIAVRPLGAASAHDHGH